MTTEQVYRELIKIIDNENGLFHTSWDSMNEMIKDCADVIYKLKTLAELIEKMSDCNNCRKVDCKLKPEPGEETRYNCPFYSARAESTVFKWDVYGPDIVWKCTECRTIVDDDTFRDIRYCPQCGRRIDNIIDRAEMIPVLERLIARLNCDNCAYFERRNLADCGAPYICKNRCFNDNDRKPCELFRAKNEKLEDKNEDN